MLSDDARELQRIADYRVAARALRSVANGSFFAGIINIVLGAMSPGIIGKGVMGLGLFMILAGILSRRFPVAAWLLVHALVGMSVGMLNIAITVLGWLAGGTPVFWGILGLLFFFGGVGLLRTYARYGHALAHPASDAEVRQMDILIHLAMLSDPDTTDRLIQFTVGKFGRKWVWHGLFHGEAILFVELQKQTVLAADREEVDFLVEEKRQRGKTLRASLQVRGQSWPVTITAPMLDRFDAWKEGEYDELDEEDEPDELLDEQEPPSSAIKPE
jgi:hypothetical protein